MRYVVICGLIACGKADATQPDAAGSDAPATCAGTMVEACGAACERCDVANDRELATCEAMTCGSICKDDAPRCTDTTCSRTVFAFEGTLDGARPRLPQDLTIVVR